MSSNLRSFLQKLKAAGKINTLAPGHRAIAEIVAEITGQRLPGTKKLRWAMVLAYVNRKEFSGISDAPIISTEKNKKKPKKPSKAEFKAFYMGKPWRALRYDALKKHGAACQCCGGTAKSTGRPLHVDHIKPRSKFPELELVLDNLQILCEDCNMGKGGRDATDWR